MEPARYFVAVIRREKRACRGCAQGVSTAPVAERIVEKGLASDAVVINTLVSKYSDYLPLYRQSMILSREAGLEISRATLDGWVMRCGELLMPIAAVIGWELLSGGYIQADETPVPVQMHDGRGKNHQAYLWQYGRPGGSAIFDFRMGRGREGPLQFLNRYEGILQTDGYSAYERVGGPKLVHAACWAHARRKFFDAVKLNPEDRVAAQMIVALTNCLQSMRRRGIWVWITRLVMPFGKNVRGRCLTCFAPRSRASNPLFCRRVHWARRLVIRSRSGANWCGSWNTRKSS